MTYIVVENAPRIVNINTFPGSLGKNAKKRFVALMVAYPVIATTEVENADSTQYAWCCEENECDSVLVGTNRIFTPCAEHAGRRLKLYATPVNTFHGRSGRASVLYLGTIQKEIVPAILRAKRISTCHCHSR